MPTSIYQPAITPGFLCGPSTVVFRPQAGSFASHSFKWFALNKETPYNIVKRNTEIEKCTSLRY